MLLAVERVLGREERERELVVEHRFLGSFALHEEFLLERRESGRLSGWCQVSLEELKLAFPEASRNHGRVTERKAIVGRCLAWMWTPIIPIFLECPLKAIPVISSVRRKCSGSVRA
jgi:hypothetical protein